MQGVIILAHGSNRKETEATLELLIKKVRARLGEIPIYPAFLQFSDRNLEIAVGQLVMEGVTAIKVVPLFLFDGIHVTQDIPAELNHLRQRYPSIQIDLTEHLGADDRIMEIVVDRVESKVKCQKSKVRN